MERVRSIVRSVPKVRDVTEIKLRRSGPFLSGRVRISVDQDMSVLEASKIGNEVEATLSKEIGALREFVVLLAPFDARV